MADEKQQENLQEEKWLENYRALEREPIDEDLDDITGGAKKNKYPDDILLPEI